MKQRIASVTILLLISIFFKSDPAFADARITPMPSPIVHPALVPPATSQVAAVGQWGEDLAAQLLRLRNYDVISVKNGNQGVDLVAVKRDTFGNIKELKFVEVKTHRGAGKAQLKDTKHGRQMSDKWLHKKINDMLGSSDPDTRKFGNEISKFSKNNPSIRASDLGEIHEINTRTNNYVIRDATTGNAKSSFRISATLEHLAKKARSSSVKEWASTQLSQWSKISETNIAPQSAIGKLSDPKIAPKGTTALKAKNVVAKNRVPATKLIARSAGPVALVVSTGMDMKEIYDISTAFSAGMMSREEFVKQLSTKGGGIIGATSGAMAGAKVGAIVAIYFGPFAPAVIIIGGVAGGVGGYLIGAGAAGVVTNSWYLQLDESVKLELDNWLIALASS